MKLSICMIVKNEEKHIAECLNSIPDNCEVIVIDTGSTDNTVEIAKSFPKVKLFQVPWEQNFASVRNISLSHATGTHILVLDADERLSTNAYERIKRYVKKYPGIPAAVLIENIDEGDSTIHRMVRLFPKQNKFSFRGVVHEQLFEHDVPAKFLLSDIIIHHYGYQKENYENQKYEFYLELYKQVIKKQPRDGYIWYQIGKLHAVVDNYEPACEAFLNACEYMEAPSLSHASMILHFAKLLHAAHLNEDAIVLLENHKGMYADYPDIYFQLGILNMEIGNLAEIRSCFESALELGETTKYTTTSGVGSYLAAYNLGVYYEVTGDMVLAKKYYLLAAPNSNLAVKRLELMVKR